MPTPSLIYIDSRSKLGLAVNTSLLVQLSEREWMDPLPANGLRHYPQCLLVCSGSDPGDKALGCIACKRVNALGKAAGKLAVIGGLLLDPSLRSRGIGDELVRRITTQVFTTMPDVNVCIAACNPASLAAFGKAGYVTTMAYQDIFQPDKGFVAMALTRDEFGEKTRGPQ